MTAEHKCEFCDKRGLPLLITRHAIALQGTRAPKADEPGIALQGKAAQYTLRLLRQGYLYVFDEARDQWQCWLATRDGYYFKIDETVGTKQVLPTKPFNCPDEGHREVASCITIPDPKNATRVWIGFSDTRWTTAVKDEHKSVDYRKRHMRVIDVPQILGGSLPKFCQPIANVAKTVAEYALNDAQGKKAFAWGPFPFLSRADRAASLVQKCDQLRPQKGVVVAIEDPAGIAQELALLMRHKTLEFGERKDFKRGVEVNGAIAQMEFAVKDMARRDALRQADIDAVRVANPSPIPEASLGVALARLFNKKLNDQYAALEEETRNLSATQLQKAADDEWRRYLKKYDEPARAAWMADFRNQLAQFDNDYIVPLAQAHVSWMECASMGNYFECNFDPRDVLCGDVYTGVLGDCIATTPDKKACFDLYGKWLCGNPTDNTNLLLRALNYNQDDLTKEIEGAASGSVDWAGLPWDKFIESHARATDKLMKGSPDTLGRLIGMIAGPLAKLLRDAAESRKVYAGLVSIGAAAQRPIIRVEVTGSRKKFRTALIKQILRLSDNTMAKNTLEKAVSDELRLLKAQGVPLEGTDKKRWLLMVDPEQMQGIPRGLKPSAAAQAARKSIRTIEQVDELNLSAYRLKVQSAAGAVRGGVPFAFGLLGLLANCAALGSLQGSEAKALEQDKEELAWRTRFQWMQVVGAVSGVVEIGLGKLPSFGSQMANGIARVLATVTRRAAMVFGVGGSMLMATTDVLHSIKEFGEKNISAGIAYLASGVLGGLATVALAAGWTGWGLILVLLMFIWSFVMLRMTDNKLQDWLERCLWGSLKEARYPDLETEMGQLEVALKG